MLVYPSPSSRLLPQLPLGGAPRAGEAPSRRRVQFRPALPVRQAPSAPPRLGTRWRRLSVGRQALLTLAHLRNGHPYAQLAAGFGIGTTTAYRYITEAVEVLAALAPTLAEAVRKASLKAFVLLDGTLVPIDRIAADRPFYSGKHKRHGVNVQVLADPFGRLLWASPALPGAVHDIRAAREQGIVDALVLQP
ncbi:hypothetical protein SHIRM173S_10582 [Streptomyces hirsutus]